MERDELFCSLPESSTGLGWCVAYCCWCGAYTRYFVRYTQTRIVGLLFLIQRLFFFLVILVSIYSLWTRERTITASLQVSFLSDFSISQLRFLLLFVGIKAPPNNIYRYRRKCLVKKKTESNQKYFELFEQVARFLLRMCFLHVLFAARYGLRIYLLEPQTRFEGKLVKV